jgi:anthranilate synthase component 1
MLLRSTGDSIEVLRDGQVIETAQGDTLNFVREFQKRFKVSVRPGLPRFCGGLAGYFGYDVVRFIEPRLGPSTKPDPIGTPDVLMLVVDELAIVDNLRGKLYLIVYADPSQPDAYAQARRRLRGLQARLAQPAFEPEDAPLPQSEVRREFDRTDYLAAVGRAKEYIVAGDVMQVQIGQCIRKPYAHSPLSLYRALRSINPSPYMYYYDFDGFQVIGASPEILVRQESDEIVDVQGNITAQDTKLRHRRTSRLLSAKSFNRRFGVGRAVRGVPALRTLPRADFGDRIPSATLSLELQVACNEGARSRLRIDYPLRPPFGAASHDNDNLSPNDESFGRHQNIPQAAPGRISG